MGKQAHGIFSLKDAFTLSEQRYPVNMSPDQKRLRAFGAALRNARMQQQMTQEQLAEAVGVARGHISMLESGKRGPGFLTICHLCEVLKIRPKELFEDV